jgi:hypothetical protein
MGIMLSWSRSASHKVAIALYEWLPTVIGDCKIWVCSEDVAAGNLLKDLHAHSNDIDIAILCVTPENVKSPWLYHAAGLLGAKIGCASVYPYLVGVKGVLITETPLSAYPWVEADKTGTSRLVRSLSQEIALPRQPGTPSGGLEKGWIALKAQLDSIVRGVKAVGEVVNSTEPLFLEQLPDEALVLLLSACESGGDILHIPFIGGTAIQTGQRQFVKQGDPRSLAAWEWALRRLVDLKLAEPIDPRQTIFRITREGWIVRDRIHSPAAPST